MTNPWEPSQPPQVKEKAITEEIVSYENLSLQLLKDLFKSAYFTVEPMERNVLRVREGNININVAIDENNKRYIHFASLFLISKQATHAQRVEYINRVNQMLIFVRAEITSSGSGEELAMFDYFLWVEGGVTKLNIVSAFKEFAETVRAAVSLDTEGIFGM